MQNLSHLPKAIHEIGRFQGTDYLNRLTSELASWIGAEFVYISRVDLEAETAHVISGWEEGQTAKCFSYPLQSTPCYELISAKTCVYNLDLKRKFPKDTGIFDLDVNSYLGLVLKDYKGNTIGIINALYRGGISNPELVVSIFEIVAIRIGAEIERILYEGTLLEQNLQLSDINREYSLFKKIIQSSDSGIVITDNRYRIIDVNRSFERMTKTKRQELISKYYLHASLFTLDNPHEKHVYKTDDESTILEVSKISINLSGGHDVDRLVFFNRDITLEEQSKNNLSYYAKHDYLTGLFNRFALSENINKCLTQNPGELKALIVFSIDNFKSINEAMGHDIGDELLKSVSQRISLENTCGAPGRVGGNEFAVLIYCKTKDCVNEYLSNTYKQLCSKTKILNVPISVSISVGVAFYPNDADDAETLINSASQALTQSKRSGRNNHVIFSGKIRTDSSRFTDVYQRLSAAIDSDGIDVYYQPIIDLASNEICGCEALARWTDPILGEVSPTEFISVAEKTGLICKIGDFVFSQATRFCADVKLSLGKNLFISINCSPYEILNYRKSYKHRLENVESLGLNAQDIHIEITESVMLEDQQLAISVLGEISKQGFGLSVDDFGTGYSSLAYLKDYPFDILKIDRVFVESMFDGKGGENIVKTIIDLANNFNKEVVAEGIESFEQLAGLKKLGCHMAQGFYFYKPMPGYELKRLLDSKNCGRDVNHFA